MDLTFVDTNILVYAHDQSDDPKHRMANAIVKALWRNKTGLLSTQVLQEFYSVATRKMKPAMTRSEARTLVADYSEWCSMDTNPQLLVSASLLEENHQLQWWDALIIEAAMRGGAKTLLSEDQQHGRKFGLLTVVNPFLEN